PAAGTRWHPAALHHRGHDELAPVQHALAGRVGERDLVEQLLRIVLGTLGVAAQHGRAVTQIDLRARALHDGGARLLLGGGLHARRIARHAEIGGLVGLIAAGDDGEKGYAEKAADIHSKHDTVTPAIRLRPRRASLSELFCGPFHNPRRWSIAATWRKIDCRLNPPAEFRQGPLRAGCNGIATICRKETCGLAWPFARLGGRALVRSDSRFLRFSSLEIINLPKDV